MRYTHTHTHTHTHSYTRTHTHTHLYTHTLVHTHTHRDREKRANQTRTERVRKFRVEGYGLTADLNVSVVGAFPTWIVGEFQTDGPEGGVARSPHVLHVHGGSFRRQMSILGWSGREGEYSFRRSGRFAGVGGGEGVETGACTFGELEQWLQPVKLTEYWCDVHSWS